MDKTKIRFLSLLAAFVLCLATAIGFLLFPTATTMAATYTASSVFTEGTDGTVGTSEADADNGVLSYVQLTLEDGGKVTLRRDLALKWFASKGEEKYFSMELQLPAINFKTLTFSFESVQESVTKDSTSKNSLIFTYDNGTVTASTKYGDEDATAGETVAIAADTAFTVSFSNGVNGSYDVNVTIGDVTTKVGTFRNIGANYLEYLSSASSTPRVPMTVEATLQEGEDVESQVILVKSLNGQSLECDEDGNITDNAPAALVLSEVVRYFPLGYKFSLSYEVVDVLKESVSVTRQYYMVTDAADEEVEYATLSTSTYFLPKEVEKELVSIRFKLDDGRTVDSDDDYYVYLSWYVDDDLLTTKTIGETTYDYIEVLRDEDGPYYTCVTNDENDEVTVLDEENEAYLNYAAAVKEASEGLNAGDGSYFYLPSLRGLITDDWTDYSNMKFTIYYKTQFSSSSSSETSLSYNALKFEVSKEAEYTFRVTATDKLGNTMKVYDGGKLVSLTSSNVWDVDIPEFTFSVKSTGATIDDPGEQTIGYLDTTYSISSFDIVAIDGYEVDYTLYYFDQTKYMDANSGTLPSYSDLVENAKDYVEYLSVIKEYDSSIEEDDDEWEESQNAYAWDSSALTFCPQLSGYYFVKASVTDKVYWVDGAVEAYQVIEVQNPIDSIAGETYFVQNNVVSIVLFSVAGALLIALIVTLVIKPSDKKVEEVELDSLKGQKKSKKKDESDESVS